jgi:membrane protein
MARLAKPRNMPWKLVGRRTWKKMNDDDVFGRSAQLAYYFFLALFPMLIFLISTIGSFPGAIHHVRDAMAQFLTQALPPSASELIEKTINEITTASGFGKISFGLFVSLWSASAGMMAVMDTLNEEHGVSETRSFLKQRGVAIGLTLGVALLLAIAAAIILIGGSKTGSALLGGSVIAKLIQWPAALGCVLGALALIYYFAPNLKKPEWHWITPGAVVGLVIWLIGSFLLRLYLHFFNNYSATYGSLGAVIILLLSFYLTGIAILMGGEVNVVIERAIGQDKDLREVGGTLSSRGVSDPAPAH